MEKSRTKDMTAGDPAKLIFNFTMPLIAGNIIQQLYGFVDTLIVGRFLGVNALAAVGCSMAIMFFMITMNVGLTSGMTILTGQRFGAQDKNGVRRSVATCYMFCTVFGVVMGILGYFFSYDILQFMGTPENILDDANSFISIFCAGMPIAVWFILATNLIRALGDSKGPTIIMSSSLALNIILEPIFLLVFGWGIPGAAWGIIVSQLFGLVFCYLYIKKRIPELQTKKSDWRYNWKFTYAHLRIALPMAFQSSLIAMGVFIVQIALNKLGPEAVASFSAAARVDSITMMPMMSFGVAMGAYTAQNFGAQNFDRIREGVRKCCQMSCTFSVIVGAIIAFWGPELIGLFVGEEEKQVIEYGRTYLWITGSTYWILSFLFVYRFCLQGVGQSMVPTFAGIMELIMRGAAAIVFADWWGYAGVCLANPMAWLGSCVPLAITYYLTVYRKKNPPKDTWEKLIEV